VGRGHKSQDQVPDVLRGDTEGRGWDLRPKKLSDYIGQANIVESLGIAVQAARKRAEPLDHILFHGPPGIGKTTLAHIVAREMESQIIVSSGPALERGGDLISVLTNLEGGDILFIDEIHRLPRVVEEFLYPAMEDFAVDFIFDKGLSARSHRYRLERFTLIGATTRPGLLTAPLRNRFGIIRGLNFYSDEELELVAKRSASILGVVIDREGAVEIAKRSRGTPRIANNLLKRVRDYAQVKSDGVISKKMVEKALRLEGIDRTGLTDLDRSYLKAILEYYDGGPVGLEALAATLQQESDTLVDLVEPFLLKIGFLVRTSSGRKATDLAHGHLGEDRVF
jgi:Holliday junction DNA helicase RuvB